MIFLPPERLDQIVQRAPRYFFASLALLFGCLAITRPLGFPVVPWTTSFALFYLSIVGTWLRRWRIEYGLWMMAGLLLLAVSMMYYLLVSWEIRHFLAARQAQGNLRPAAAAFPWLLQVADVSVAAHLFWRQIQFCLTVIRRNWRISKSDWQAYKTSHRIGLEYQPAHVVEKYRRRRRAVANASLAAMGMLLFSITAQAQANRNALVITGGVLLGFSVVNTFRPRAVALTAVDQRVTETRCETIGDQIDPADR